MVVDLPSVPERLSASGINRYLQCPYKYLCSAKDITPRESDTSALLLGSAVHKIIEDYYKFDVEGGWERYLFERFDGLKEMDISPRYLGRIDQIRDSFIGFEAERIERGEPPPAIVEGHWERRIPGREDLPKIHGYIDYYDGERMIDWKTGSSRYYDGDREKYLQGRLYVTLLDPRGTAGIEGYFLFLLDGELLPISDDFTVDDLIEAVETVKEGIERGHFEPRQNRFCTWCDYMHVCPEFGGSFPKERGEFEVVIKFEEESDEV